MGVPSLMSCSRTGCGPISPEKFKQTSSESCSRTEVEWFYRMMPRGL
jgi:hypothetical protein